MHKEIVAYHKALSKKDAVICNSLAKHILKVLPEAEYKIWHKHPVWFLGGNPVVGYHKLKDCVRMLFWSGQSFQEKGLKPEGSFKAAEVRYTSADQIQIENVIRWLRKARDIQWDYKNIVKNRGHLTRLKNLKKSAQSRIYSITFARVYPMYIAKAERKGRTKHEVDTIIRWLTGYTQKSLGTQIQKEVNLETFFSEAPLLNPARLKIKGVICGVRIEEIQDPLMREVRFLDKLIDDLARGKTMEKILFVA